jgi:hypothetical protein
MRRDGASNVFIIKQGSEARKSQKAYTALAENEEWLVENADKLGIRSSA